jgi:hypothetical protein
MHELDTFRQQLSNLILIHDVSEYRTPVHRGDGRGAERAFGAVAAIP